jgi:uracil-DNA glycosylase
VYRLPGAPVIVAAYHPSRQNTHTGRLTPAMLKAAFKLARKNV